MSGREYLRLVVPPTRGPVARPTDQLQAMPTVAAALLHLQRQRGNSWVQRFLRAAAQNQAVAQTAPPDVQQAIDQARGGGQALDSDTQARMGRAFGTDFRGVRIHTDSRADTLNRAVDAVAFTTGQDVFFRQGAYDPGSPSGRRLLAHELTHILQQGGLVPARSPLVVGPPDDEFEIEAERTAEAVAGEIESAVGHGPVSAMTSPPLGSMVQRRCAQCEEELHGISVRRTQATGTLQRFQAPVPPNVDPELAAKLIERATRQGATAATREATRQGARRPIARAAGRLFWGRFWKVIVRRFALRGALAVTLSAADGPLPIGELISLGLAVWTLYDIYRLWDQLVEETERDTETQTDEQPQEAPLQETEPLTDTETGRRQRRRSCRTAEPCEHPLPVSWPAELPYPEDMQRMLVRTSQQEREWEGVERGAAQAAMRRDIVQNRSQLIPPPQACFDYDAEPNTPYDAHHIHPMYIGGEDALYNLCAVETGRHMRGHRRLDNQSEHLDEYLECGICSPFLSQHSVGQTYTVTGSK